MGNRHVYIPLRHRLGGQWPVGGNGEGGGLVLTVDQSLAYYTYDPVRQG